MADAILALHAPSDAGERTPLRALVSLLLLFRSHCQIAHSARSAAVAIYLINKLAEQSIDYTTVCHAMVMKAPDVFTTLVNLISSSDIDGRHRAVAVAGHIQITEDYQAQSGASPPQFSNSKCSLRFAAKAAVSFAALSAMAEETASGFLCRWLTCSCFVSNFLFESRWIAHASCKRANLQATHRVFPALPEAQPTVRLLPTSWRRKSVHIDRVCAIGRVDTNIQCSAAGGNFQRGCMASFCGSKPGTGDVWTSHSC